MLETLTILGAALVGGFLLNFTPCVLPVLGLKVHSLITMAHDKKSEIVQKCLLFCSGLLLAFLALAGIIIGVKSLGGMAVWGFQFQSSLFCLAMAIILGLVGLSMLGVGRVLAPGSKKLSTAFYSLSGGIQSFFSRAGSYLPKLKAFFMGIVTAVVGSACAGPMMAPALAGAFLLSWPYTLAVLALIGVGMGLPYLLFAIFPRLLKWVPKPGKWMRWVKWISGSAVLLTAGWFVYLAL